MRPLAFFALLYFFTATALAQTPQAEADAAPPIRFRVEIDAPRPYKGMLERGLDLARWQRDERVTLPLLERLVAEARKAAADALAAEGYFSANVRSNIDTPKGEEAVVRLAVEPGPRTRVADVDLAFSGPAVDDDEGRASLLVMLAAA